MLEFVKFFAAVIVSTLAVAFSMAALIALLGERKAKSDHPIDRPVETPERDHVAFG